jgi:hypothetical protein
LKSPKQENYEKSSPNYQQSNGLAERFVQTAKRILTKSQKEGKDTHLSILAYRNTSTENIGSSAQILMNRRLRSTLPATNKQLKPKCTDMDTTK